MSKAIKWRGLRPLQLNRWKVLVAAVLLLWLSGLADHLFTTSFDEFTWPPNFHLRSQVEKMVRRAKPKNDLPTPWSKRIEMLPQCGEIYGEKQRKMEKRLLVVVKSAVGNYKARKAIRETWGADQKQGEWAIRVVFVLGATHDKTLQNRVMNEADEFFDILLSADFLDGYYNNGRKFGLSLWLSTASFLSAECPAAFTLLIDDDYMLHRGNLLKLLSSKRGDEPLYEGWKMTSSPFRFRFHKHRVSLSEYPFNAYPPYITAGAVLLSAYTVERFYLASLYSKLFAFDDVYAGILAKQLSIYPQHNEGFTYWTSASSDIDWKSVIAAHGFDPKDITKNYPVVSLT